MNYKMPPQGNKTKSGLTNKNPLETIRDFGSSTVQSTTNEFKKIGSGMFDQFFGNGDYGYSENSQETNKFNPKELAKSSKKQEFKVFNYNEYYENELVKRQIKELSEMIKREIEMIKRSDASLLNEVKDIQNLTLDSLPNKVGIYHIRFLEIVLNILRTLRLKIGESKTWLQALVSKKKKRGSLFVTRSKKQGTLYSMSQELQNARSIQ